MKKYIFYAIFMASIIVNIVFFLSDGILYLRVRWNRHIENNYSEYDYPQFALPLYNLCSNVGLYETAAITNRSNILSPKYLRLNL